MSGAYQDWLFQRLPCLVLWLFAFSGKMGVTFPATRQLLQEKQKQSEKRPEITKRLQEPEKELLNYATKFQLFCWLIVDFLRTSPDNFSQVHLWRGSESRCFECLFTIKFCSYFTFWEESQEIDQTSIFLMKFEVIISCVKITFSVPYRHFSLAADLGEDFCRIIKVCTRHLRANSVFLKKVDTSATM